ncbi:MAG TPA: cytochrome P450 [Chloroflexia bacterium]|nr:cytochrome P450 [Chloroflexia bacterium]
MTVRRGNDVPELKPIPGPRGYPLLGVIPKLARDPFHYMVNVAQQYGGVARLNIGPATIYLVSHPDHVRHILVNNAANYWKGPILRGVKLIIGDGLFASDGDLWRRQRRLMSPTFSHQRLRGMVTVMTDVISEHMARWRERSERGEVVDMLEEMVPININILLKTIFGTSISYKEARAIRRASDVIFNHSEKLVFSFFVPMRIPRPGHRRFMKALAFVDSLVDRVIAERRRNLEDTGDVLSTLLLARDEETGEAMDDRQIRDEVMSIFMAGYESTAAALAWAWYLLSQHPAVEEKLQAELASVLAGRTPTFEDLPRLKYTRMIVDETMRLYPPFPTFFRTSYNTDQLGDYHLPPNAAIILSPYVTHRNPLYWQDPDHFDPERFSPERAAERQGRAYYPFGMGQRLCIGSNLSLIEQQLIIAMVAQQYQRHLKPGYVLEPHYDIALRPRYGVPMLLTAS